MPARLPTYAELEQKNQKRSPAWRHERAQEIFREGGRRPHQSRDDRWTKRYVRYLVLREKLHDMEMKRRDITYVLHSRFPAIHWAYELFMQPSHDMHRYTLEASLLTDLPFDQLAKLCSMSSESVEAYEAIFFSVRDRLEDLYYICANVIGKAFQSGLQTHNPELMTKYFAYFGGDRLLNLVLNGFTVRRPIRSDDEMSEFLDSQIQRNLRTQALITTAALQPSRFDIRSVIEGYSTLLSLELRGTEVGEEAEWVNTFVQSLRKELPIPRGSQVGQEGSEHSAQPHIAGHLELRADEQNRVYSEQGIPYFDQLAAFKLPEPSSDVDYEDD